jgi:hypothetical protein
MTIEEYYLANRPRTLGDMIARGFPRRQTQMNEAVRMTQESQRQRLAEEQAASDITQGRAMAILNAQAKAQEDQIRYQTQLGLQGDQIRGQWGVNNAVEQAQRMAPIQEGVTRGRALIEGGFQDELERARVLGEQRVMADKLNEAKIRESGAQAKYYEDMGQSQLMRALGMGNAPQKPEQPRTMEVDGKVFIMDPNGAWRLMDPNAEGGPSISVVKAAPGIGGKLNEMEGAPGIARPEGPLPGLGGPGYTQDKTQPAKPAKDMPGLDDWSGSKSYNQNTPFVPTEVRATPQVPMSMVGQGMGGNVAGLKEAYANLNNIPAPRQTSRLESVAGEFGIPPASEGVMAARLYQDMNQPYQGGMVRQFLKRALMEDPTAQAPYDINRQVARRARAFSTLQDLYR